MAPVGDGFSPARPHDPHRTDPEHYRVRMNGNSDTASDRAWAGRVVFPRSTAELRSTSICPACLTPLVSVVCRSCGLDLRNPASAELAAASAAIADEMDARADIIGRIRRETAAGVAAPPAPAVATLSAPAAAAAAPATVHVAATPSNATAAMAPGATTAVGGGQQRSGIQIALVVVGISLLSVFAVFGLVYAFVTYGSEVRMTIIAAGTLATIVAAGVLGRRGLVATAEGVAALGSVMLVLDAWAVRLNDPSGIGTSPEGLYWGIALLVIGASAALWSRVGSLATPGVVSAGVLPFGSGLVTAHLVGELAPSIQNADAMAGALAAFVTAAVSWSTVPAARALPHRAALIVAQSVGAVAAVLALATLFDLDPGSRYSPAIAGAALAAAAALPVAMLARIVRQRIAAGAPVALDRMILGGIGGGAAFAAVIGAVISAVRFDQDRVIVSAPLLAAAALAVLAEQGWHRTTAGSAWRTAFSVATITAAVMAAVAGGLAAIVGVAAFVEAGTHGSAVIRLSPGDPVTSADPATAAAIGALGLSLGITALSWSLVGLLVRRARALTLVGGIVLVAAVPLLGPWWLVMLAHGLLAIGGAAGLYAARRIAAQDARRAVVALCIPLSTGAALGAFLTGWAVPHGWAIGLGVAVLTIGIARPTTAVVALRAVFVGVAASLVLGSLPELARDLASAAPTLDASIGSIVLGGAALVIIVSQLSRLAPAERWVAEAVAVAAALLASWFAVGSTVDEAVALTVLIMALSLVVVRGERVERLVARTLLPLAVARTAVLALTGTSLDDSAIGVVALSALIMVAAVGLVSTRAGAADPAASAGRAARVAREGDHLDRLVGDIAALVAGIALVLTTALTGSSTDRDQLWLPVLVLALLVLVVSISRDGLIGSASRRRFVGWAALAIAAAALWMRLIDSGETSPEPYALPLAGAVLLVVAANELVRRSRPSPGAPDATNTSNSTAAPLTAAALLAALIPTALASVDGSAVRAIAVGVVGIALVIVPLITSARIDRRLPFMTVALVSSGLLALTVLATAQTADLIGTAFGSALEGAELVRAALVVFVLCALAVVVRVLGSGRLHDAATAATVGVAAVCAATFGLFGAVDPVELVSLPVALALLAIGTLQLDRDDAARSWPWLGPGFVVLLAPSLLAIDGAGDPLWRAVAVGVAAASVFTAGVWRRLQAPFVIGGIALLTHLLVQSWPLLAEVGRTIEWWLWLGLAGVLIVVIAARYERRVQNVRAVARRIADLR